MQPTATDQALTGPPANRAATNRTAAFRTRPQNRYWWHHRDNCDYEPLLYSWLSDREMQLFEQWLVESEAEFGTGTGECGIPPMSILQGLVVGNGLTRMVQLGHYVGYSTFLLGLMMKRMNNGAQLFSVDIDPRATEFTQGWVERFGVADQVTLKVIDSSDPQAVEAARANFGGLAPQMVFIDSSHAYRHTLAELDRWYPALQTWGFIMMHDASVFASDYDAGGEGGVNRAIEEWNLVAEDRIFTINAPFGTRTEEVESGGRDLVYIDGCGLGLLQKTPH